MWVRAVEDCDCINYAPRKGKLYDIPQQFAQPAIERGELIEVETETAMLEMAGKGEVENRVKQPRKRGRPPSTNQPKPDNRDIAD